jgi:hypothetical protein
LEALRKYPRPSCRTRRRHHGTAVEIVTVQRTKV